MDKNLIIRKTKKIDIPLLNKQLGAQNIPWLHQEKFEEQEKGDSSWLIAWKNKKPIADISVPSKFISGDEIYAQVNDSIIFDASPSYDPDGEIIFYKWTFPPDTSIINKDSYTHSFKKEGTYSINLVVIDNDGSSNSINTSVNIRSSSNRPPVAVSNGHYSGKKGKTIT